MLKSFQAINRKLLRILEESGVERLAFPDGKAEIGLCKIVDTEVMEGAEDGTIVSVIRSGYRRGERILRPAEVITVANR
jgi:molecular chaperone GrpE (heat shock protein)